MFERWKEAQRAGRLRVAERRLRDEVHMLDRWSFGDTPSQREDRLESIYMRVRRVEELGGDVLAVLPSQFEYLVAAAMPEAFERVCESFGNGWKTVRKET